MTAAVISNFQPGWTESMSGESDAAQQIQQSYAKADVRAESTSEFNQSRLQRELIRLYSECHGRNWDGYGASPLSVNGILRAMQIAGVISPDSLPTSISPEPDGEVALEWAGRDQTWLSVSLGDSSRVTYAGVLGKGKKIHGEDVLEDGLPDSLLKAIEQVSRRKPSR